MPLCGTRAAASAAAMSSAASPNRSTDATGPAATAAASASNDAALERAAEDQPDAVVVKAVSALITASGLVALESSTNATPSRSATVCEPVRQAR